VSLERSSNDVGGTLDVLVFPDSHDVPAGGSKLPIRG
jgi:hypothetical protein